MSGATDFFLHPAGSDAPPGVYEELRRLAAHRMSGDRAGQTLQPTALVHEAWLKLSSGGEIEWENREHFFAAAAQAMRRILVDRSRGKAAAKRQFEAGGEAVAGGELLDPRPGEHILLIHESLEKLEKEDPEAARVVLFRFFSGLSVIEIARMTGRSVRSVERLWTYAKARLYQMVRDAGYYREGE